jgi:hypothetical protein
MPQGRAYDPRAGRDAEAAREAQVAAALADLRAKLARPGQAVTPSPPPSPAPVPGVPVRCRRCGYLTNARGHLAECEEAGDA